MTSHLPPPELLAHLERQLGFIDASCLAYDKGATQEAIRIATSIRVLIHNTNTSTSLLKHLNATTINLHTTAPEVSADVFGFLGMGIVGVDSTGNHDYKPALDDSPTHDYVPVSKWWGQVVFIKHGVRLSRREIVLAAANQDGGAHVDAKLDPGYSALKAPGFAGAITQLVGGKVVEISALEDTHLMCLRQMGYELLTSPDLAAIGDA